MRHFAHNIGDYAAATRHLSFVEDAAYRRLLDRYYQDERPLPPDLAACARLVGARSKEEKQAVANVLTEFFEIEQDGYHQRRADREIATYREKADAARRNGTKGGRPPNRRETEVVSPSVRTGKLTTPHSPSTNTPPSGEAPAPKERRHGKSGTRIPDGWRPSEAGRAYAAERGCDPDATADAFIDWWSAANGPNAVKRDWDAAFRTWCRRDSARPVGPAAVRPVQSSRGGDAYLDQLARIASRDDAEERDRR